MTDRRIHGELGLAPPAELEAIHWAKLTSEHYPETPVPTGAGASSRASTKPGAIQDSRGASMTLARLMPADEVVAVVEWLIARDVTYQINGGWGVDALVGNETREHRDLDLFVDSTTVPRFLQWLSARGYHIVEDWLPVRVQLASERGRVDVHPMKLGVNGDGIQQGFAQDVFVHAAQDRAVGLIGGIEVVVASADRQRQLRTGYETRPADLHDLKVLDHL